MAISPLRRSGETLPWGMAKTTPFPTFDPRARNAAKDADRRADAARIAAGVITPQDLDRENAFIPYSVDLSRWTVVFDSLADEDGDDLL